MKILSIETSCDETAISIIEATGSLEKPVFTVLGNSLFSQIELHKEYGGVFPALAKREHGKNLPPLLMQTLKEAGMHRKGNEIKDWKKIEQILEKEPGMFEIFKPTLDDVDAPPIDVIAVTSGPGLEPALWVGISFARALQELWNIPVVGVNHMEGHITSVLIDGSNGDKNQESRIRNDANQMQFPALALLISGGHTELVQMTAWGEYSVIGQTRDDAVGEAFDKVARLLGLPYPGGPEISRLAAMARETHIPHKAILPRPMIHSGNLDFSFSGLKTAVLYYIRDHEKLTETDKMDLAREFEDAVVEVLLVKTKEALDSTGAQTLIIAGGVIANKKIRESFMELEKEFIGLAVKVPDRNLATDNAIMIASAAYVQISLHPDLLTQTESKIIAKGNLKLGQTYEQ